MRDKGTDKKATFYPGKKIKAEERGDGKKD
jgi:hypothetical protein